MAPRAPEIWLVRHGETGWSRSGQHTGRTDVPLTGTGEREAAGLAARLARRRFALVLSSPLARAWNTCRLAGFGDLAERCDDLMEWDYGAFEGLTSDQIQQDRPGWTIWTGEVPGGETVDAVGRRAARVIDRASAAGGDVLLVSHGHLLRVLGAVWLGFPARDGRIFSLDTASLGLLGRERDTRQILAWNVTDPAGW